MAASGRRLEAGRSPSCRHGAGDWRPEGNATIPMGTIPSGTGPSPILLGSFRSRSNLSCPAGRGSHSDGDRRHPAGGGRHPGGEGSHPDGNGPHPGTRGSSLQVLRSHSGLGRADPDRSVPLRNRSVARLNGMKHSELESVRSAGGRHARFGDGSRPPRRYRPRPEGGRRGLGVRRSRLRSAGSSRIGAFSSRTGDRRDRGGRHDRSAVRAAHQDRLNPRSEGDCRVRVTTSALQTPRAPLPGKVANSVPIPILSPTPLPASSIDNSAERH